MDSEKIVLCVICPVSVFLFTFFVLGFLMLGNVPGVVFFILGLILAYAYYHVIKNELDSRLPAIIMSIYLIIAFQALILMAISIAYAAFPINAIIYMILWLILAFIGFYGGARFYENVKSKQLETNIRVSKQKRSDKYLSELKQYSSEYQFKYYPVVFLTILLIFWLLYHFNLTLGLDMWDLARVDIMITLWIGVYFKNKLAFKWISMFIVALVLILLSVDFLERNMYFGLGSPNTLRAIILIGGTTLALVLSMMWYKWKMGEF